jgi:hypothetical protein
MRFANTWRNVIEIDGRLYIRQRPENYQFLEFGETEKNRSATVS